jgi:hypothetical protein
MLNTHGIVSHVSSSRRGNRLAKKRRLQGAALSPEKAVALRGRPPRERWTRSFRGSLAEPQGCDARYRPKADLQAGVIQPVFATKSCGIGWGKSDGFFSECCG